jgi:hypothetical protein
MHIANRIQVRNFKDIDLDAVEYTFFDGKNMMPRHDATE